MEILLFDMYFMSLYTYCQHIFTSFTYIISSIFLYCLSVQYIIALGDDLWISVKELKTLEKGKICQQMFWQRKHLFHSPI